MKERDGCFIEIVVATILIFWLFIDCDPIYLYATLLILFVIYFIALIVSDYKSKKEGEQLTSEIIELTKQKASAELELSHAKGLLSKVKEAEDIKKQIEEYVNNLPKAIKDLPHLYSDIKMVYLKKDYEEGLKKGRWGYKTVDALTDRISKAETNTQLLRALLYKLDVFLLDLGVCTPLGKRLKLIINEIDSNGVSISFDLKRGDELIRLKKQELNAIQRRIDALSNSEKVLEYKSTEGAYNTLCKKCEDLEQEQKYLNETILELIENKVALQKENYILEREIQNFVEGKKLLVSQANTTHEVLSLMAKEWAEYECMLWDKAIAYLLIKKRPIKFESATELRQNLTKYKNEVFARCREVEYKYNYIQSLFPDLQKYIDENVVEEVDVDASDVYEDRREKYLSKEEWLQLSETEKSQLALDRYNERRKRTNAQVGRDYEEYIAYLFRKQLKGCEVIMFGEQRGLSDLGRDLIVRHKEKAYIVQCKRWSVDREIREKHIMQLFGTTIEYCWDAKKKGIHPLEIVGKTIIPVFVTTAQLSETARQFAEKLSVTVAIEPNGDYPQIKCNVGREGEKIYHLPFDQQYNKVIIEPEKGEFMAWTVEEAEQRGFRRAKKYYNV